MVDLARQYGYRIASFHHAVEAYKVADVLARRGICAVDLGGLVGLQDGGDTTASGRTPRRCSAGGCAVIHSDDPRGIQRLNQEAAKDARGAAALRHHGSTARRRFAGSRSIRRVRSASTMQTGTLEAARWPTSSSGAAIRSASTAHAEQVFDRRRAGLRPERPALQPRPTSSWANPGQGSFIHEPDLA